MHFLPTTILVGTAALLFTATTVHTSPLPPHNTENGGPLVPFCTGPLGVPLICPRSVPDIHLTPVAVVPDSANDGIKHDGQVSEKRHGPEGSKENKIEPRSENDGVEQHGVEEVCKVPSIHRGPVVIPNRANGGKEHFTVVVTHDGANGGKEGTVVVPESYNDGIEHGNDEVVVPASYNDGIEHGGVFSEKGHQAPKEKIEPRSPDFGQPRYVSVAEDHWGKWQGNDAWFATPRVPKDRKVGP